MAKSGICSRTVHREPLDVGTQGCRNDCRDSKSETKAKWPGDICLASCTECMDAAWRRRKSMENPFEVPFQLVPHSSGTANSAVGAWIALKNSLVSSSGKQAPQHHAEAHPSPTLAGSAWYIANVHKCIKGARKAATSMLRLLLNNTHAKLHTHACRLSIQVQPLLALALPNSSHYLLRATIEHLNVAHTLHKHGPPKSGKGKQSENPREALYDQL